MAKITYTNKVALNENPEIADINKVKNTDLNEIKTVVNNNDDLMGDPTTLTTTSKTSIVSAVNELNSNKALKTDLGTIANLTTTNKTSAVAAINELNSNKASANEVLIQDTEPTAANNKLWIDTSSLSQSDETNMKYNDNGTYKDIYAKAFDTLPVGTEVDYDGETVPSGWSEVTQGYTLLDNSIYYKKVGKMVTLFRPARTTTNAYIQNEISLADFNYTNLNASNKLLPTELRPSARIGFTVFVHTTGNENLTRCYGEILETGYIAIYNWGSATTANRLVFCVTYMVD